MDVQRETARRTRSTSSLLLRFVTNKYTGLDTQTYSAIFGGTDGGAGTEWFISKNAGNTALGVQDVAQCWWFREQPGRL